MNDHVPIVSEMPHGGFKQSGVGKDMSAYAIEAYTELKHVMIKTSSSGGHRPPGNAPPISTSTTSIAPSSSNSKSTAGFPTPLGAAVGLSEAAVRQRVQRLLDTGVMQVVAVTDPLSLGLGRMAMIGVKCEGDVSLVADKIGASTRSTTS